ncbi:MAG: hypothetical protein K6L76_04940 [Agarilytica sp.]
MARRKEYYLQLEQALKLHEGEAGELKITRWLECYLTVLGDTLTDD